MSKHPAEYLFSICDNGDPAAGLMPRNDDINIIVYSGDPGGEPGEFAKHMRQALADWYDCPCKIEETYREGGERE
jgi:hypothetical protein